MVDDKKRKRDQGEGSAAQPAGSNVLTDVPNTTQAPAAVRAAFTVLPSPPPAAARKRQKKTTKRKTLSTKGRKAVVMNVIASVEAQKLSSAATPAPPAAPPVPPPQPTAAAAPVEDPASTSNLGKAWTKADLTNLARLAEDPAFLREAIPDHPPGEELNWEIISRYFGRYSKGGNAVKQQYYAVVRLMKEARREGRKGSNYVDLVKKALGELPGQRGTVFDIQRVLKEKYIKHLNKYKVKGKLRWKKAVGEILREETSLFYAVSKTESGKHIWELRQAD